MHVFTDPFAKLHEFIAMLSYTAIGGGIGGEVAIAQRHNDDAIGDVLQMAMRLQFGKLHRCGIAMLEDNGKTCHMSPL